jgi:hypothetical protein
MLLALYWGWHFFGAMEDFVIAFAVKEWYIADGNDEGWPAARGIVKLLRYVHDVNFADIIIRCHQSLFEV